MNRIQNLPLENALKVEMESRCTVTDFDKHQTIVEEGNFMRMIPLLLSGSIRVFRRDYEQGREILLYYIEPGETCMMSLVSGLKN